MCDALPRRMRVNPARSPLFITDNHAILSELLRIWAEAEFCAILRLLLLWTTNQHAEFFYCNFIGCSQQQHSYSSTKFSFSIKKMWVGNNKWNFPHWTNCHMARHVVWHCLRGSMVVAGKKYKSWRVACVLCYAHFRIKSQQTIRASEGGQSCTK